MIKEKYIKLLDIIFNEQFEDNDYSKKWENFDSVSSTIEGFQLRDFADNCSNYLEKHRGIDVNISGAARIMNDFPVFSNTGMHSYLQIKEKQIENVLYEHETLTDENTKEIFENLNQSAIKQIIGDCIDKKIVGCNGKIYENNKIIFKRIVPFANDNSTYNNYIINTGTMSNISQNININDMQLYSMILSKVDLMREELGNKQNEKIDELILDITQKDKKSVLTILSELCSIGSVIAAGIMAIIG